MATFQETREQAEQKVLVELLGEIERNAYFTQRSAAKELGIALGLMNQYLKRCIAKGWVRASKVSPRRISYFLTPEGFAQKSKMVATYLSRSLNLFREAKEQCEGTLLLCQQAGYKRLALLGESDLANIVMLVGKDSGLYIQVVPDGKDLKSFDAVLITDVVKPQRAFDAARSMVASSRIFTLKLLHISRGSE